MCMLREKSKVRSKEADGQHVMSQDFMVGVLVSKYIGTNQIERHLSCHDDIYRSTLGRLTIFTQQLLNRAGASLTSLKCRANVLRCRR